MTKAIVLLGLLLGFGVGAAAADEAIRIEGAWARATPPVVPAGAAYMTIVNQSAEPDRLTGLSGPVAQRIELHESREVGGVMTMRLVEGGLVVVPNAPLELRPGGLHVMLIGLRKPLVAGQTFSLTLHFEKVGDFTVRVPVHELAP